MGLQDGSGLGARYYSARELAHLLDIAPTTIANWVGADSDPLAPADISSSTRMYTLDAAVAYMRAHPGLRSVRHAHDHLAGLNMLDTVAATAAPPTPSANSSVSSPPRARIIGEEDLASIARDVRTALDAALNAASRHARLARETAKAHEDVVADLHLALRSLDGALSIVTGPIAPPVTGS